ncbi:two-component sensor histidine kinase [Planotetraspora silvatica]|uniref:histidine kinase n=1 Tax=Planotetraspora silvatica TaxID=234614 RepID=A0A8J3XQA7_9ACTN|nr:HAMP domain-containing sensor histidine kinase [Planotetraspora silvatica]GII48186.1 two-component sensor histidine kinase [Planotetraspora silvatica]
MSARRRLSITTRVTLFTGVVATVLSALLATVVMVAIERYAVESATEEITAAGARVAIQLEQGRLQYPLATLPLRSIQVVDSRRHVVASTPDLRGRPPIAAFTPEGRNASTSVVCGGVHSGRCDLVVAQRVHRRGERWIVYAASPAVPFWVDPRLATLVGGLAALLAVIVTCLGRRTVVASLRPVTAIRSELDQINAASSGRRVPVPPTDDEIHELAESVNHTLCRLHVALRELRTALDRQRQMVADVSHDLRTPVTAMRAEVEDALLAPDETSVTALGAAVMPRLDRLQAIAQNLVTITQLESGMAGAHEPVDLSELVAAELCSRPPAKRIDTSIDPGVVVLGDRSRLARLFTNLIDNAERHAQIALRVSVRQEPSASLDDPGFPHGVAVMEVIDDGPGIDPDKRELVFQRFTRLDPPRTTSAGGAGLGLTIARQIAEAGGGTLGIEDSLCGARFVLRLPAASPPGGPSDF